jgi:hypothetical protein
MKLFLGYAILFVEFDRVEQNITDNLIRKYSTFKSYMYKKQNSEASR